MKIKPKIWQSRIDPDYYEIFIEEGVEYYEDSDSVGKISIFRVAEDNNRIIGIGFHIENLRK